MGSMKRKRRKKLAREWAEFQTQYELSDESLKLARSLGQPPKRLHEILMSSTSGEPIPIATQIGELRRQQQEKQAIREAAIESGELKPKPKKPKKKLAHDPQWAKAKEVCRLNMEDIRMAKELGLTPKSLIKNVLSPSQQWKTPVRVWIRDRYEERQFKAKEKSASQPSSRSSLEPPNDVDTYEEIGDDWRFKVTFESIDESTDKASAKKSKTLKVIAKSGTVPKQYDLEDW